jgi:hypothetical protein
VIFVDDVETSYELQGSTINASGTIEEGIDVVHKAIGIESGYAFVEESLASASSSVLELTFETLNKGNREALSFLIWRRDFGARCGGIQLFIRSAISRKSSGRMFAIMKRVGVQ